MVANPHGNHPVCQLSEACAHRDPHRSALSSGRYLAHNHSKRDRMIIVPLPRMANIGPELADVGQKHGVRGPRLIRFARCQAKLGRHWAKLGKVGPCLVQFGAMLATLSPKGRIRINARAIRTNVRAMSGPRLLGLGRSRAQLFADLVGQFRANWGQFWAILGRIWCNSARHASAPLRSAKIQSSPGEIPHPLPPLKSVLCLPRPPGATLHRSQNHGPTCARTPHALGQNNQGVGENKELVKQGLESWILTCFGPAGLLLPGHLGPQSVAFTFLCPRA